MNTENPTPEPNKEHVKMLAEEWIKYTHTHIGVDEMILRMTESQGTIAIGHRSVLALMSLAAQGAREEQYFKNLLAVINDDTLTENGKILAIELSLQQRIKFAAQGATPPQPVVPRSTEEKAFANYISNNRWCAQDDGLWFRTFSYKEPERITTDELYQKYIKGEGNQSELDQHTTPPEVIILPSQQEIEKMAAHFYADMPFGANDFKTGWSKGYGCALMDIRLKHHTTPPDELVEKIVSAVINVGDIEDDQNGNITTEININELRAAITKILKP